MADSFGDGYHAGSEWANETATHEQLVRLSNFTRRSDEDRIEELAKAIVAGKPIRPIPSAFVGILIVISGMMEADYVHDDAMEPAFDALMTDEFGTEDPIGYFNGFMMGIMRNKGDLVYR